MGPTIHPSFLCATSSDGAYASRPCHSLARWPVGPPALDAYVALFVLLLRCVPLGVSPVSGGSPSIAVCHSDGCLWWLLCTCSGPEIAACH